MASPSMLTEQEAVKENLKGIKNRVMILSGKGGVGKSTIAFSLAAHLAKKGKKVGLLDVDIHGPSIPGFIKSNNAKIQAINGRLLPLEPYENLKVISIGYLLDSKQDAVIWRGPLKFNMIKTFLSDVEWGDLDYLIIDSPPGTGDESLTICQMIGEGTGAVMVTTPQQLSVSDVRRAVSFCRQLKTPVIGVVENMSGLECPHCGKKINLFKSGGGEELAKEMDVPFLGALPIKPEIVEAADEGTLFERDSKESGMTEFFDKVEKFFE